MCAVYAPCCLLMKRLCLILNVVKRPRKFGNDERVTEGNEAAFVFGSRYFRLCGDNYKGPGALSVLHASRGKRTQTAALL